MLRLCLPLVLSLALLTAAAPPSSSYPFQNVSLSVGARMANLLSLLTLDEKVSRLYDGLMYAPPLPRLSIPTFEWGQECLRGARNNINEGNFSAFPQSIGLAASWNVSLFSSMGQVVSDEMRGQRNSYLAKGRSDGKTYLHCWAPIANVLKDPRWGRAAESYGESTLLIYSYTSHYLQLCTRTIRSRSRSHRQSSTTRCTTGPRMVALASTLKCPLATCTTRSRRCGAG